MVHGLQDQLTQAQEGTSMYCIYKSGPSLAVPAVSLQHTCPGVSHTMLQEQAPTHICLTHAAF
jgi:hypothetical protein